MNRVPFVPSARPLPRFHTLRGQQSSHGCRRPAALRALSSGRPGAVPSASAARPAPATAFLPRPRISRLGDDPSRRRAQDGCRSSVHRWHARTFGGPPSAAGAREPPMRGLPPFSAPGATIWHCCCAAATTHPSAPVPSTRYSLPARSYSGETHASLPTRRSTCKGKKKNGVGGGVSLLAFRCTLSFGPFVVQMQ